MPEALKPPFWYFGSKARLAPTIVALLPPHRTYVEPYAGSAAVLLAKPVARHEVLNDRNGNVVAFFRALREQPDELERVCRLSPYARDEYAAADIFDDPSIDALERARRLWVRSMQGMSGIVERRTTWSGTSTSGGSRAKTTKRKLDQFELLADRLLDCIVDNRDAIDCIRRHGMKADAVVYADPPYLRSTRQGPGGYALDSEGEAHHRALAEVLHETEAFVVLSGYASPLYDELFGDWHRTEIATLERAGALRTKGQRIEVLWTNRAIDEEESVA